MCWKTLEEELNVWRRKTCSKKKDSISKKKKQLQGREDYETVKGNKYKTNWNRYFRKEKATWWQLR